PGRAPGRAIPTGFGRSEGPANGNGLDIGEGVEAAEGDAKPETSSNLSSMFLRSRLSPHVTACAPRGPVRSRRSWGARP
ncbi:MAG TPA: hypothetical protein VM820_21250, partial [Vicinamibacterales bacterium]|nr:hypothetical protein [Vicinamibacterales bacterium]